MINSLLRNKIDQLPEKSKKWLKYDNQGKCFPSEFCMSVADYLVVLISSQTNSMMD